MAAVLEPHHWSLGREKERRMTSALTEEELDAIEQSANTPHYEAPYPYGLRQDYMAILRTEVLSLIALARLGASQGWKEASCAPNNTPLLTWRDGECESWNICWKRNLGDGDEWIEKATGVTTVTHKSFAPPTHWKLLDKPLPDPPTEGRVSGVETQQQRDIDHLLKVWPAFFPALESGAKTFELRKDDRDFATGNILQLAEWDPKTGRFTGRSVTKRVTYILHYAPQFGLMDDYCILSLADLAPSPQGKKIGERQSDSDNYALLTLLLSQARSSALEEAARAAESFDAHQGWGDVDRIAAKIRALKEKP